MTVVKTSILGGLNRCGRLLRPRNLAIWALKFELLQSSFFAANSASSTVDESGYNFDNACIKSSRTQVTLQCSRVSWAWCEGMRKSSNKSKGKQHMTKHVDQNANTGVCDTLQEKAFGWQAEWPIEAYNWALPSMSASTAYKSLHAISSQSWEVPSGTQGYCLTTSGYGTCACILGS